MSGVLNLQQNFLAAPRDVFKTTRVVGGYGNDSPQKLAAMKRFLKNKKVQQAQSKSMQIQLQVQNSPSSGKYFLNLIIIFSV